MPKHTPIIDRINRDDYTVEQLDEIAAAVAQKRRSHGVRSDQRDDEIAQLKNRVIELETLVEQYQLDDEITADNAHTTIDRYKSELIAERQRRKKLEMLIEENRNHSRQRLNEIAVETGETFNKAVKMNSRHSPVARAIHISSGSTVSKFLDLGYGRMLSDDPADMVAETCQNTALAAVLLAVHGAAAESMIHSHYPPFMAQVAMLHLRSGDNSLPLLLPLLQYLPKDWIRDNVAVRSDHVPTPERLAEMLQVVQHWKATGMSQDDYAEKHSLSVSQLKQYSQIYSRFDAAWRNDQFVLDILNTSE